MGLKKLIMVRHFSNPPLFSLSIATSLLAPNVWLFALSQFQLAGWTAFWWQLDHCFPGLPTLFQNTRALRSIFGACRLSPSSFSTTSSSTSRLPSHPSNPKQGPPRSIRPRLHIAEIFIVLNVPLPPTWPRPLVRVPREGHQAGRQSKTRSIGIHTTGTRGMPNSDWHPSDPPTHNNQTLGVVQFFDCRPRSAICLCPLPFSLTRCCGAAAARLWLRCRSPLPKRVWQAHACKQSNAI